MTADVVILDVVTKLDLPPERILRQALETDLDAALVLGWTKDGQFYFASSYASSPENLYLMERARHELFKVEDRLTDDPDAA